MSLEPGQVIDAKYRVVRRIGEGGMGTVYEGENQRIGRRVAIKVLHAQVAAMPEFVERFEREARAAARIGSPHVCDVLDLGDLPSGDRYIVMEYLDGVSFEDRLVERGKLTPAQLAPIAFELLEGLGTMHVARVIHRDLKPANVFLAKMAGGRGEVVKILDFGVAKLLPFGGEVGTMTQTGTMMGTPLYMSPEQARGARDVDGRTDIYAASVMFYRALAGKLPYNADTLNELLFKIVLEDPRPLREVAPEIDEVFAGIIHKGLARDLEQRFVSARAYQEAIAAWGRSQGRQSLAFALTLSSEPPGPLPPAAPSQPSGTARAARPVANAVTGASAGTPIAWSEDAPDVGGKGRAAATLMTPVPNPPAAGGARPGSDPALAQAPSGATTPSASDPKLLLSATGPAGGAEPAAPPAIVDATTAPNPVGEVARATAAPVTVPRARASSPSSKRNLILGLVGAGAAAAIAVLALRGGGDAPAGVTQTPGASAANVTPDPLPATPSAANEAPATNGSLAATDAGSAATPAEPPSQPAAAGLPETVPPATARRDATTSPTQPRKNDIASKTGTTPATTASPATAAPATATTPVAKPTSSARKFRTNID